MGVGDDPVRGSMNDQERDSDSGHEINVPETIDGKERYPGDRGEGRGEGALQHDSGHLPVRGQPDRRSTPH